MAEIFLGELQGAEGVSKLVAVKRMLAHLTRQPGFVAMFLDEARLAAKLSHPNIVQVFDFGEEQGSYFIAMEYLPGENLYTVGAQAVASRKRIPLQVAMQIMIGACDGLHYAHEFHDQGKAQNLVHRDVSPSNLMITFQGGVKVLDFGIARAAERQQEKTETGVVKGKFPYCSPEQLRTKQLDRRSDLFSLGSVFYEILVGRRLFRRDTDINTCLAVLNEPIPAPSLERPDIPPALDAIVLKALDRDPERRYQTALEMRRDIENLLSGPPARIDEFMSSLFGEQHVKEKLAIISSIGKLPTAIDAVRQSIGNERESAAASDVVAAPPPRTPVLPVVQEEATVASTPSAKIVAPPSLGLRGGGRSWMLALALIGLVALASLGAFLWLKDGRSSTPPVADEVATEVAAGVAPEVPAPVARASLRIDSLPRGAAVEVCGNAHPERTPTTVENLLPGDCVVVATLEGHHSSTQIVPLKAGAQSVVLELQQQTGRVSVEAPRDARVRIDGQEHGTARSFELAPGRHAIRVELASHRPFSAELELKPGAVETVVAKLEPIRTAAPGTLDVSCQPWCRVFVDGKDVGKPSPIVGLSIAAGRHTLKMEHPPTGRSREVVIQVKPGDRVRETAVFK